MSNIQELPDLQEASIDKDSSLINVPVIDQETLLEEAQRNIGSLGNPNVTRTTESKNRTKTVGNEETGLSTIQQEGLRFEITGSIANWSDNGKIVYDFEKFATSRPDSPLVQLEGSERVYQGGVFTDYEDFTVNQHLLEFDNNSSEVSNAVAISYMPENPSKVVHEVLIGGLGNDNVLVRSEYIAKRLQEIRENPELQDTGVVFIVANSPGQGLNGARVDNSEGENPQVVRKTFAPYDTGGFLLPDNASEFPNYTRALINNAENLGNAILENPIGPTGVERSYDLIAHSAGGITGLSGLAHALHRNGEKINSAFLTGAFAGFDESITNLQGLFRAGLERANGRLSPRANSINPLVSLTSPSQGGADTIHNRAASFLDTEDASLPYQSGYHALENSLDEANSLPPGSVDNITFLINPNDDVAKYENTELIADTLEGNGFNVTKVYNNSVEHGLLIYEYPTLQN